MNYTLLLADLINLEYFGQIFEKSAYVKFYKNPSSGSPDVPGRQVGRQAGRYDEVNSRFSQLCQCPYIPHKSHTDWAEIELWTNTFEGWQLNDWRTAGSCNCSDCGLFFVFFFFETSKDRSEKLTKTGYKCAVLRLIYSPGPLNIRTDDKLHNYINELRNSVGNSVEKWPSWETNNRPTKTWHLIRDYSSTTCSKNACTSNRQSIPPFIWIPWAQRHEAPPNPRVSIYQPTRRLI